MSDDLKHEIAAIIGGRERIMRLERDPFFLEMLERKTGPLFRALSDFASGDWTSVQLFAVLSAGCIDGGVRRLLMDGSAEFRDAITVRGSGTYAPLAAKLIAACLLGVSDHEASFDDAAQVATS